MVRGGAVRVVELPRPLTRRDVYFKRVVWRESLVDKESEPPNEEDQTEEQRDKSPRALPECCDLDQR